MWRSIPGGTWVARTLVLMLMLAQVHSLASAAAPRKRRSEAPPPKVEETVGDLAFVVQKGELRVEGVGLVAGLENTGADPPPSWFRTQLVDEMSKAGVEHASKLLANPQFSMVLVRMTIPTGATPKDRLDVEIEVPPACGTKTLAGGYLMATRMREVLVAGGAPRTGPEIAVAQGPVMIGNSKDPNNPKAGRVLGGGRVKKEFPYTLVIKDKRKSIRTAAILERVVNGRFHQSEAGKQKGAATAKTDSYLVLNVPPSYHQNQERFFRVVQLLPMIDTPDLRDQRTKAWAKELLDPRTSGVAAMRLEGLAASGTEALESALKSPDEKVRFFAAEALAYLDNPAGADALGETAIKLPEFRAYALAALAAMDQPAAHMKLRQLMDATELQVRYGAFNALRTLDPRDPSLGQVRVLDDPSSEEDEPDESPDAMAIALASAARRPRAEDPFALYIVDSEGPPVVHVSRSRRSEVVIFGRNQKLLPPIVLGSGAILLNAADKDEEIEISKIVPSKFGDSDVKLRTSLELGEVIRRAANMGATYPEIVSILESADRQKNLPGVLVVDAVPTSNPAYLQAAIFGKDPRAKSDPSLERASTQGSRLRRLFSFRNREPVGTVASKPAPAAGGQATAATGGAAAPNKPAAGNPTATPGAGTAPTAGDNPPAAGPKKDDGLQRAAGGSAEAPRTSLLNRILRRSE